MHILTIIEPKILDNLNACLNAFNALIKCFGLGGRETGVSLSNAA
jgi:hypothetical protein